MTTRWCLEVGNPGASNLLDVDTRVPRSPCPSTSSTVKVHLTSLLQPDPQMTWPDDNIRHYFGWVCQEEAQAAKEDYFSCASLCDSTMEFLKRWQLFTSQSSFIIILPRCPGSRVTESTRANTGLEARRWQRSDAVLLKGPPLYSSAGGDDVDVDDDDYY